VRILVTLEIWSFFECILIHKSCILIKIHVLVDLIRRMRLIDWSLGELVALI